VSRHRTDRDGWALNEMDHFMGVDFRYVVRQVEALDGEGSPTSQKMELGCIPYGSLR
jgi:hypothetical protein